MASAESFAASVARIGEVVLVAQSSADAEGRQPVEADYADAFVRVFGARAYATGFAAGERLAAVDDPVSVWRALVTELYTEFAEHLAAAGGLVAQLAGALAERAGVEPAEVIRQCVGGAKAAMNDECS